MICPKIVCLDSATWGNLARDQEKDADAKRLVSILNTGTLIPFITWYHLEEICQHANAAVYDSRVYLFESLRFVAFPQLPQEVGNVGSLIELRNLEISALLENPTSSLDQIVGNVRPEITNGFCSGRNLCESNRPWWDFYRTHFATAIHTRKMTIASLTQFPPGDQQEQLPPPSNRYKLRRPDSLSTHFQKMFTDLTERLKRDGDSRLENHEQVAADFVSQAAKDGVSLYAMDGDEYERLLKLYGVERSRLPKNAKMEDVGYEAIFRKQLGLHEQILRFPSGHLDDKIKQDVLPSWIIWREVDRAVKRFPKASAGNLNDKSIIAFLPYVDALECDKRIRESYKQSARSNEFMLKHEPKLLRRKNYADLITQLERIAVA